MHSIWDTKTNEMLLEEMLPEVRAEETQRRKCSFQECSRENQWGRGANEVGERKNDVKSSVTLLLDHGD